MKQYRTYTINDESFLPSKKIILYYIHNTIIIICNCDFLKELNLKEKTFEFTNLQLFFITFDEQCMLGEQKNNSLYHLPGHRYIITLPCTYTCFLFSIFFQRGLLLQLLFLSPHWYKRLLFLLVLYFVTTLCIEMNWILITKSIIKYTSHTLLFDIADSFEKNEFFIFENKYIRLTELLLQLFVIMKELLYKFTRVHIVQFSPKIGNKI